VLGKTPPSPAPALPRRMVAGDVTVAFCGNRPGSDSATAGHAPTNDCRALNLLRRGELRKPAPLSLNTLALDAIRAVPKGAHLRVAM